ncbi:hypothetical protein JRO89_XS12G0063600 [Xanthoceras sorbifolium]|uniref:Uncharacterized protein n=1 Tax=Xanthoceras sorbifolium TaxID=99658 RepID=A0ABQ8HBH6_9ROSI|nr:hypothetical protein JRO89_XS12G0063600 [Xanthoceras sorbifolium]
MGELSRKIDVEKLVSYSDDLVEVLKDKRDINTLTQCLDHSKSLHSCCDADLNQLQSSIQDYQRKIDVCKQKTEQAKSEVAAEAEVDHLQIELEEEFFSSYINGIDWFLATNTIIMNEINDLELKRISIEERKRALKKSEKDELRADKFMIWASAFVKSSIAAMKIYLLESSVVGLTSLLYMVDRDKKVVEKLEYDPAKMTAFDTCQSIWKAINSS